MASAATMRDLLSSYPYPVQYHALTDGPELAYLDQGQGPVILMVHGLASYSPTWLPNIAHLSQRFRCLAVDLPGFGHSEKPQSVGSLAQLSDWLSQFLTEIGVATAWWMGHSMGGQISLWASLRHPDRVQGLLLSAPAGFETFNQDQKQQLRQFYSIESIMKTPEDQVRRNYGYNFFRMPAAIEAWMDDRLRVRQASDFEGYARAVVQCMDGMLDEPVFDRLPEVSVPTLVVYGEEDFLIPNRHMNPHLTTTEVARQGAARLPGSALVMVPEAGHFVHFEQPHVFHLQVDNFLRQHAPTE